MTAFASSAQAQPREMKVKTCDVNAFQQELNEWRGSAASFNAYSDDHDRFVLKLAKQDAQQGTVGIAFFYCSYLAGPSSWSAVNLVVHPALRDDGSPGYEVRDTAAGFVVRFASASLYGNEEAVLPERD